MHSRYQVLGTKHLRTYVHTYAHTVYTCGTMIVYDLYILYKLYILHIPYDLYILYRTAPYRINYYSMGNECN